MLIDQATDFVIAKLARKVVVRDAGLPEPDFAQDGDQFAVTLWRDATPRRLGQLGLNARSSVDRLLVQL